MSTTFANMSAGSQTVCAMGTYQITAGSTATHLMKINVSEVPASGMTVSIQLNGVTKASLSAPQATQNNMVLSIAIAASQGDTLAWVLASSSDIDNQLNTVKATLNVRIGGLN